MAEVFEIDLDSKHVIVSKNPLTKEDYDRIIKAWEDFVNLKGPALFIVDGAEYEFRRKEE